MAKCQRHDLTKNDLGPFITNNDLDTSKIFLNKSTRATWNGLTGKYTFYGMGLHANTHSTECASGQIHILRNASTGKYTFYGMRLQANTHSTEWTYGQIHILRNGPTGKYTFSGQIYILRNAHMGKYIHFTEWAYG